MNSLEALGFETAAAGWLETNRGEGRLLRLLVQSPGRRVAADSVDCVKSGAQSRRMSQASVIQMMSVLRSCLSDVGFPSVIQNEFGIGWFIEPYAAGEIFAEVQKFADGAARVERGRP